MAEAWRTGLSRKGWSDAFVVVEGIRCLGRRYGGEEGDGREGEKCVGGGEELHVYWQWQWQHLILLILA